MLHQPLVKPHRVEARKVIDPPAILGQVRSDRVESVGSQRVLAIVTKPLEAIGIFTIVEGDEIIGELFPDAVGSLGVARKVGDQHVGDEVILIQIARGVRYRAAVGVDPLEPIVIGGEIARDPLANGMGPVILEALQRAIHRGGDVARVGRLDVVPIFARSAQVALRIVDIAALLGLVKPPVLAIDVEMVEAAASIGHLHVPLGIAGKSLADEGIIGIAAAGPGPGLGGAQVNPLEFIGALILKKRKLQAPPVA